MFHVLLRRGATAFISTPTLVGRVGLCHPTVSTLAGSRFFSRSSRTATLEEDESDPKSKRKIEKKIKQEKFKNLTINNNTAPEQARKLAEAFDELAQKEGFLPGKPQHFANDENFDKQFSEADWAKFEELDDDDEGEFPDDGEDFGDYDNDDLLDPDGKLSDVEDDGLDDDGGPVESIQPRSLEGSGGTSMAERIAAAKRDATLGRVTVPEDLDQLAKDVTPQTLASLGFRKEDDPWGNDVAHQKPPRFKIISDPMSCSACGADFQSRDERRPGYLAPDKFEVQQKLLKIDEMRKLQEKATGSEWSPDDEIEWLIQSSGKDVNEQPLEAIDLNTMAEQMGLDLKEYATKKVICKRCHNLQFAGKVGNSLRPGWSDDPLLAQERFRALLRPIGDLNAVIIALVDLFDFAGSVLPELDSIAGPNPVIIAANKADLLPSKMGPQRAQTWVRRELRYMGIKSLANVGGAVRLVSCKTGMGVFDMLDKARALADERNCDIYVVGAANAGKSTLLNYILRYKNGMEQNLPKDKKKKKAGNLNQLRGEVTVSPLPGTTLKFIKVELEGGRNLYDTPGLLVPGALTQLLTPEELKIVVPKKKVEPITLRIASGKCVLVGGLARVAVIGDSKPFLFTFFVANEIKIHPTDLAKSDEFRQKHAGGLLTPPLAPGEQRLEELGEFEHHEVEIAGKGWKEAAADIALTGLGWVAVTGAGPAKVRISVPKGIAVSVRPPLMPFDIWESVASYTGGRAIRKTSKLRPGKGRSGVGRN